MASSEAPVDACAGFFGKVSSHGDFVARRLPPSFQNPWDAWLQAGMQASRQALATRWLATYLSSPIWRFALAPRVCGSDAWAGVLMPSVDRVGRHFPLTLAAVAGAPLEQMTQHGAWYAQLEELALSTLDDGFALDAFDAALLTLTLPRRMDGPEQRPAVLALDPDLAVDEQLAAPPARLLAGIAAAALDGHSLWWTDGSDKVAPCLVVCRGMPEAAAFSGMLDGEWRNP